MSYYTEMVAAGREREIGRSEPQHFRKPTGGRPVNDETRLEPSPPLGHIHFYAKGNKLILTMQNDGKLVRGEGFDSDHAASVAMMDVLAAYVPCFISDLRRRAERAEAELARLKAT